MPADRRLPVQAQPRHLCPRLGRLSRAGVRRRRRRGAVEAGRAELGRSAPSSTTSGSATSTAVRLRLLRLRRGDRARLALLGHRLVRPRGAGRRRPLPRRRLGRRRCPVQPAVRQRLGGRRLRHPDRRHREDFGEGSFDKGILLTIPLRWTTPFETRQTINGDLRSLASDGGAQLNIANRLYPTCATATSSRLERNWGAFWQ